MRTLAFDGGMGASGDMLLGALLAAGAERDALAPVEDHLDVRYEVEETTTNGIQATTVNVVFTGRAAEARGDRDPSGGDRGGGDGPDHPEDAMRAEGHGPARSYRAVVDLVRSMDLPPGVEADALGVFERLGTAEARVHGTDLQETHFHEVGADDAIADVVGVALLLADLDVERVVTTPPAAGGGEVETHHGTYPVPTPAVAAIAEAADWELRGGPVEAELLTPTGAAVLAHVATGVEWFPPLRVEGVGYGAGSHRFPDHPNVLRATVGTAEGGLRREEIRVLETNVDDVSPELLGDLQRTLTQAGARDVAVVPLTMKKSRPGHLVKVVVEPGDVERVARRLAAETGTLGVREAAARHRFVADRHREVLEVDLAGERWEVAVKVARDEAGTVLDVSPEYDDAAAVAEATNLPVKAVMRRVETAYRSDQDA